VEWGAGTSERVVTARDGMGFAIAHTVVRAGTESRLQYTRHLEACYCIGGSGSVREPDGTVHEITPGTVYVLDAHDA
ncbi:ectoine synthase, partial [Salmonella enterica]|uniref:ectoine synthase n=1 Tax=Salmonella enterica TaxID=28901 RepID=UPI003EDB7B92